MARRESREFRLVFSDDRIRAFGREGGGDLRGGDPLVLEEYRDRRVPPRCRFALVDSDQLDHGLRLGGE